MDAPTTCRAENGFTILELSFVLAIIGLVVGFGVSSWNAMQHSRRLAAARTDLETTNICLENYAIHSGRIPDQAYYQRHCTAKDPWSGTIIYENTGDNQEILNAGTKPLQDSDGLHPDVVWVLVSTGKNLSRDSVSTTSGWDCTPGDDLCHFQTRNDLLARLVR